METSPDSLTTREFTRQIEPQICAVEPGLVDWFWVRVSHWIENALHRSVMHELSLDEVYQGCKDGTYLLLAVRLGDDLTGSVVVAASTDPTGRPYLGVICCGGERLELWMRLLVPTCRLVAAQIGAREIVMMGRPGWRRYLAAQGARLRAVVMVLDLEETCDG